MTIEQCRDLNCAHVSDTRSARNCGLVDCSYYPNAYEECLFEKEESDFDEYVESCEGNSAQDGCYVEGCERQGIQSEEQAYTGIFNVSISPDLHRRIVVYALEHDKSLNAAVEEAIEHMVR